MRWLSILSAWLNTTIQVQRRPSNPARNSLNEPNYGAESSYPTIYSGIWCRIEYWDEKTDVSEYRMPSFS